MKGTGDYGNRKRHEHYDILSEDLNLPTITLGLSLITCISHTQSHNYAWSHCCVLHCRCAARGWAPRFQLKGAVLHASVHLHHAFYGCSVSLEQAIVRLGLCMLDFGGMRTSSFGRFTPHLCLIPSMHDS